MFSEVKWSKVEIPCFSLLSGSWGSFWEGLIIQHLLGWGPEGRHVPLLLHCFSKTWWKHGAGGKKINPRCRIKGAGNLWCPFFTYLFTHYIHFHCEYWSILVSGMTDSEHKRLRGDGECPKKSPEMLLCFTIISVSSWCLSYECSIWYDRI